MSAVVISGDSSGSISLQAPAVAGTTTLTLPTTSGTLATQGVGQGQTWTDMTSSRALSTTYTNSTGKPIMVSVNTNSGQAVANGFVNGVQIQWQANYYTGSITSVCYIVPPDATYQVTMSGTGGTIQKWFELR